jgi:hypothetical protein
MIIQVKGTLTMKGDFEDSKYRLFPKIRHPPKINPSKNNEKKKNSLKNAVELFNMFQKKMT